MCLYDLQESRGDIRETGFPAHYQTQFPIDLQLRNGYSHQFSGGQFMRHSKAGNDSDAAASSDEALHGLHAWQLDSDVEGCPGFFEGLDDSLPKRRIHIVGDEALFPKIPDADFFAARERMPRLDDDRHTVPIDGNRSEVMGIGSEGEDADFCRPGMQLCRDATSECPLDGDTDFGQLLPETIKNREEIETGVFIGGDGQAAPVKRAEFVQCNGGFAAECEQSFCVGQQDFSCRSERTISGNAFEEDFAYVALELANDLADRGLRSMQLFCRAGEAFQLGNSQKGFELIQIQGHAGS